MLESVLKFSRYILSSMSFRLQPSHLQASHLLSLRLLSNLIPNRYTGRFVYILYTQFIYKNTTHTLTLSLSLTHTHRTTQHTTHTLQKPHTFTLASHTHTKCKSTFHKHTTHLHTHTHLICTSHNTHIPHPLYTHTRIPHTHAAFSIKVRGWVCKIDKVTSLNQNIKLVNSKTGQNLRKVFNFRCGCTCICQDNLWQNINIKAPFESQKSICIKPILKTKDI
jgi:hypothetical protein